MTNSSLRQLLDFEACAQRDKGQAHAFLHRRDRKFALSSKEQGLETSPRRWVAHINRFNDPSEQSNKSAQTLRFWGRVSSWFFILGAIFGVFSMLGLLFYDGAQRINVTIIIVFVFIQVLLALLTTIQSLVGWQPWRFLLHRYKHNSSSDTLSKLHPILMAKSAQLGGLAFASAGLITLIAMVLLQDLAFGWSTTIDTDAKAYHWFVNLIATPWAHLWPAAAPDFDLVEATRFFRASLNQDEAKPEIWGQWWPFIAMLWTTWALLPRLILFLFASFLVSHKAHRLLLNHQAMKALMYRMETETLDTGNEQNDAADYPDLNNQVSLSPLPKSSIILTWAGAGDLDLPKLLTQAKNLHSKVGGKISLAKDQLIIEQVAAQLSHESNRCVLLVTRSWEPPTGELEDFIHNAKKHWPKGASIVLVPLATNPAHEPQLQQVKQWMRFASRIQDQFVEISVIPSNSHNPKNSEEILA